MGRPEGASDLSRACPRNIMDNRIDNAFGNHTQLKELRLAHRDLDAAISELTVIPHVDQLRIRRLKKEKLRLKDLIARMENAVPS